MRSEFDSSLERLMSAQADAHVGRFGHRNGSGLEIVANPADIGTSNPIFSLHTFLTGESMAAREQHTLGDNGHRVHELLSDKLRPTQTGARGQEGVVLGFEIPTDEDLRNMRAYFTETIYRDGEEPVSKMEIYRGEKAIATHILIFNGFAQQIEDRKAVLMAEPSKILDSIFLKEDF